jgi:hypothetical protein
VPDPSAAIIAQVEANLRTMFAKGIVIETTGDDEAEAYLAKASMATDPVAARGYRELAEEARKAAK